MTKQIELTQGYYTLVDDKDYKALSKYKWFANVATKVRAVRRRGKDDKPGGYLVYMHRWIVEADGSEQVDHINGNSLDNRRRNLRKCSQSENLRNQRARGMYSRYKGVTWHKPTGKWMVQMRVNGKRTHLGLFEDEVEAAKHYDSVARKLHGRFGRYNFPLPHEQSAID